MKKILIAFIFCFYGVALYGQELADTLTIFFRKESSVFDAGYRSNGASLENFCKRIEGYIDSAADVDIEICGAASPEGDFEYNRMISASRTNALRGVLSDRLSIPEDRIRCMSVSEDWDVLVQEIESDTTLRHKSRILDIIAAKGGSGDEFISDLMSIDNARTYWYIYHNIYPEIRACRIKATVDFSRAIETTIDCDSIVVEDVALSCEPLQPVDPVVSVQPIEVPRTLHSGGGIYEHNLKINAVGYLMAVANIACEFGLSECLSVNIPFYYSGVDYFSPKLKFRVCTLQPELRYHFQSVPGLFAGAHVGVGWYNMALLGDYRIQSHRGRRPAIGGGLSIGGRINFRNCPRLGIECAVGAGVYDVRYDRFYNVPDGAYAATNVHDTFIGIDNLSVSLTYNFNFRKEGRR